MNNKFKMSLVVDFEIGVEEAAHILADPIPVIPLNQWLNSNTATETSEGSYNVDEMRKALGAYLANKKVSECKLLAVSTEAA